MIMTTTEILEFAEVRGYNPERRASNLWYLQVEDVRGHTFKGFGLHVMRDQEEPYLVLYHDRGRMAFRVDEVADAGWFHIREWTHVAERVA